MIDRFGGSEFDPGPLRPLTFRINVRIRNKYHGDGEHGEDYLEN